MFFKPSRAKTAAVQAEGISAWIVTGHGVCAFPAVPVKYKACVTPESLISAEDEGVPRCQSSAVSPSTLLPQESKEFVGMGGEGVRAAAEVGPAPLPCCSAKLASVARCGFGLFPFQQILKHIRMCIQKLPTRKNLEKR